jgi:hypothetical protein
MAEIATKNGKLSARQEQAIAALLIEPTVTAAAAKANVPERTLYRWLDEPAFTAAYRAARRKAVKQTVARLQRASAPVVSLLLQLAASDQTPAMARVAARRAVLDYTFKAVELEDLDERLSELEARLGRQP